MMSHIKKQSSLAEVKTACEKVRTKVANVFEMVEQMTRALKGDSVEMLEDLVDGELTAMEKAIEEAAKRIEVRIFFLLTQA